MKNPFNQYLPSLKAIEKELKGELKHPPYKRIKKKLRLSEILGAPTVKKDKQDIEMVE